MRIFRSFNYRVSRKEKTDVLISRIGKLLTEKADLASLRCELRLTESTIRRVSPIQRVIKKYPQLARYVYHEEKAGNLSENVLSNRQSDWQGRDPGNECKPLPLEMIVEIARGIPRRYPFHGAQFHFRNIEWVRESRDSGSPGGPEGVTAPPPPKQYLKSEITLTSDWWTSGRLNALEAKVEMRCPGPDEDSLPELPQEIRNLLDQIGKIRTEEIEADPTLEEKESTDSLRPKAMGLLENFKEKFPDVLEKLDLPHDLEGMEKSIRIDEEHPAPESLPDEYSQPGAMMVNLGDQGAVLLPAHENVSPKKSLTRVLKPLGYKYKSNRSGQGLYVFAKGVQSNNRIELLLDFAPMARMISGSFHYRGPLWEHRFELPFSRQIRGQYPIQNQQQMEAAAENVAVVIEKLEQIVPPELDTLYGSAPRWFEYEG